MTTDRAPENRVSADALFSKRWTRNFNYLNWLRSAGSDGCEPTEEWHDGFRAGMKFAEESAASSAEPQPVVSDDYVLVPRTPTTAMLSAAGMMSGYDAEAAGASPDADHVEWWQAMVDAAAPDTHAQAATGQAVNPQEIAAMLTRGFAQVNVDTCAAEVLHVVEATLPPLYLHAAPAPIVEREVSEDGQTTVSVEGYALVCISGTDYVVTGSKSKPYGACIEGLAEVSAPAPSEGVTEGHAK